MTELARGNHGNCWCCDNPFDTDSRSPVLCAWCLNWCARGHQTWEHVMTRLRRNDMNIRARVILPFLEIFEEPS